MIYKRDYSVNGRKKGIYWFAFYWNGERIQKSTKLAVGPKKNLQAAKDMEAAYRLALAKGEVGILERKPAPMLKDFAQRFIDSIQVRCAQKPATIAFYAEKLGHLLKFDPLANARLDQIDEALIESYVQERSKAAGRRNAELSPATVNRDLATLRRALHLACEWRLIHRVPRIRLLAGEQSREFVLSHADEGTYLAACPQPLADVAMLIADTGLRTSEALKLEWRYVQLAPAPGAKYGYIHVPGGKSRNARRNVPLTDRVAKMLLNRSLESKFLFVFPSEQGKPYRVQSLDHIHRAVRVRLQMPDDFVVYSLRHTYGTRLGEAGADPFTIMKLMGHSSVTVSQRYVHPTPEGLERAVERLQQMNAAMRLPEGENGPKGQLPATVSATADNGQVGSVPVSHLESVMGV